MLSNSWAQGGDFAALGVLGVWGFGAGLDKSGFRVLGLDFGLRVPQTRMALKKPSKKYFRILSS